MNWKTKGVFILGDLMSEEVKNSIKEQTQSKPAVKSTGVQGGLIATVTGIVGVVLGATQYAEVEQVKAGVETTAQGVELIGLGLAAVLGGLRAIRGRIKAELPVRGILK